jgi:hypothetical protein
MLRMMRWGLGLLGLAAAGVIAVSAVGIGGGASAQTPPEDEDKSAIEVHGDRYRELLAEELGISVDELTAAQKSARDRLLDEKVAEGKLTEEQAERLKSREIGEGRPLGFWLGFGMRGKLHSAVVEVFKVASDVLGIDVEELRDRIAGGESLTEIAESQGMDEEALKTELVGALTDRINQAVTDGDIDQELADRLLEHLDEMVDRAIDREGPFHHMDFEGPRSPRFESFMN